MISVKDNGRESLSISIKTKQPAVETILTTLHAGGKFGGGGYKVSGGLHGVGLSVVNALSEKLKVLVSRDGKIHEQTYERGLPITELKVVGDSTTTGTTIIFKPDREIFTETTDYDYITIRDKIKQIAFLTKGLQISLEDQREEPFRKDVFKYDGGIKEYVEYLNKGKEPLHPDIIYVEEEREVELNGNEKVNISLEIAMQYTTEYAERSYFFTNNIYNENGGPMKLGSVAH